MNNPFNCFYRLVTTLCFAVACIAMVQSCASVSTSKTAHEQSNDMEVVFSPYSGPKIRLQVIEFGVPSHLLEQYPELSEKRVGWGCSNRLVESFYESNRFEFVEEKEVMLERMATNWALSQSGIADEKTVVEPGSLKIPQYMLYAEVYDFSTGTAQTVRGVGAKTDITTRIGIQIRVVSVEDGTFIPASGVGEVTVSTRGSIWAFDETGFDQSAVGKATHLALNTAINGLVKRMNW